MPRQTHEERALAWARHDERARALVRTVAACPDAELGSLVELGPVPRWLALSVELEDGACGFRPAGRLRRRDLRRARERLGFDPARVEWGAIARAVLAEAPGA